MNLVLVYQAYEDCNDYFITVRKFSEEQFVELQRLDVFGTSNGHYNASESEGNLSFDPMEDTEEYITLPCTIQAVLHFWYN